MKIITTHALATLLAFGCLTLLLPGRAQAYDPKIGHTTLSQVAMDAYAQCFPSDTTYQRKNVRDHILTGDTALDEGLLTLPPQYWEEEEATSLFSLSVRVFNWHFYNPNLSDPRITKRLLVNQSYRYLWRQANYGFSIMGFAEDQAIFLGAIMHLVEDVSVPAHVVPVYHGPTLARYFGHFSPLIDYLKKQKGRIEDGLIKDAIDYLPPNSDSLLAQVTKDCVGMEISDDNPNRIRDELAHKTLAALEKDIDDCPGVPWAAFWNGKIPAKDSRYFKRYNLDAPAFGKAGPVLYTDENHQVLHCTMRDEGEGKNKAIDPRYKRFLTARHRQAIQADLRLLHWASQNMAR